MSARYLEGIWKVSGRCLEVVWNASGRRQVGVRVFCIFDSYFEILSILPLLSLLPGVLKYFDKNFAILSIVPFLLLIPGVLIFKIHILQSYLPGVPQKSLPFLNQHISSL